MYTRRDFGKIALAAIPASSVLAQKKIDSTIAGVMIGAQSYSFREKPLDGVIQAMVDIGLGECELFSPHVEPKGLSREDLRKWRLTVPLEEMRAIRKKFDNAGINLYALNLSFNDSFSEEEIDRRFEHAKALGVGVLTASSTLTAAKRIAPFAEKHNLVVAFHGHSDTRDPHQFAEPESFAQALAISKQFAINLDIGHFEAANYDPLEYIKQQHDHILELHLKDRKRNQRPTTPYGQDDTKIKEVLQLLKKEKYPMRALIEYEYQGASDSVTEVKKCFEYCKQALA